MRAPVLSPNKKRSTQQKPIEPEYVTRKQAAALLQCSDQLISKFVRAGKLRAYRLGTHAVRIKRIDLDALMVVLAATPSAEEVRQ